MGSIWQPFDVGHKVDDLTQLEGLVIADPDALQGSITFVADTESYYRLSLTSGLPFGPDVRPTILGGDSRWLRVQFATPLGGLPSTIQPDDPPSPGVSSTGARSDHVHGIVADVAGSLAIGDVASEGVGNAFARADHVHAFPAPLAPTVIVPDAAASPGVATRAARSDHVHGIVADVPVPIGAALAEGASNAFARADHVHTLGAAAGAGIGILVWGCQSISTTTTPRFLTPGYDQIPAPTTDVEFIVPQDCTIDQMYLRCRLPGTNGGQSVTYTFQVNAIDTLLAITVPPTALTGSDLVNAVNVNAGDRIRIRVTKPGGIATSPTDIMVSVRVRSR